MDSETIVRLTYEQVLQFLQSMLGVNGMSFAMKQLDVMFPTWKDLWNAIKKWLVGCPMNSMKHSVHNFAQIFPNYPTFEGDLNQSLSVHEDFWNQVHHNLCVAKDRLSS